MIIYLAGNITVPREKVLMDYHADRLYSYYYHEKEGEFFDEFDWRIKNEEAELLPPSCSR